MKWSLPVHLWTRFLILFLLTALAPTTADAGETYSGIKDQSTTVTTLQKTQAEPYHTLREKKHPATTAVTGVLPGRFRFGGLIEIEAAADNNDQDGDSSSITLATVELGLDAKINEYISGHLLMLFEENSTEPAELDEATITISLPRSGELTLGKIYLPFGVFNSHLITDPQTLELGEISERSALLRYAVGAFQFSAAIYSGDTVKSRKSKLRDYTASIIATPNKWLNFGISYISNIADSNADLTRANGPGSSTKDNVSGTSAFLNLTRNQWGLNLEYLGANRHFSAAALDSDGDGKGERPVTYNIELAYAMSKRMEFAARLEGNKDFFDFPERQYGTALTYAFCENVSVSLEYLHGKYKDNGNRDLVTAQLAIVF